MSKHASERRSPEERLTAVWPWLLIPLVALTLFFILRTVRQGA
jgi:type VI protein secretion system component VasF